MKIRVRMSMSPDGYVTTPDGGPPSRPASPSAERTGVSARTVRWA